jgi:hypothetical protein
VSLRKSPCLTPALLASNRRNANKSTGPRTARGKAWSRLNHLRDGWRSPEYLSLITALFNAPPGRVGATAHALLSSKLAIHPLFMEIARICVRAEMDIGNERRWKMSRKHENRIPFFCVRSRNVYENKQKYDHLPEKKSDISTQLSDISYKRTGILQNFAETAGFSVAFRALGNEFFASRECLTQGYTPRRIPCDQLF